MAKRLNKDFTAVQIFDMTGKMVYQSMDSSDKVLDVSNLRQGLYVITLTDTNHQKLVQKLVKK